MRTRIWHSDWKPRCLIRCVSAALLSFMDKQDAVFQGCSPVAAMSVQHTDPAGTVPIGDEVFIHDPDCFWQVLQVLGHTHGLPETPQIFTHGRSGTNVGQFGILARYIAAEIPLIAVRRVNRGTFCIAISNLTRGRRPEFEWNGSNCSASSQHPGPANIYRMPTLSA